MIRYDGSADSLYIRLADGVVQSQTQVGAAVVLHQGANDEFLGIEIREASRHIQLKDLGRLILGEHASRGECKAVLELPKTLERAEYHGLLESTHAYGWEVAPARRRMQLEAMLEKANPKALLFVRRKQPA